jgi:ComF family protein
LLSLLYPETCQICEAARARPEEGFVCPDCRSRPGAIRFIRPPFCRRCGLPFDGALTTEFTCTNCHDVALHFTAARSATIATGLVRDVIHRFKYQRQVWFEPLLVDLLLSGLRPWLADHPGWDALVPVPLHPQREREREFNQSQRLAVAVSRAIGLPCWSRVLRRRRATETQTALSRDERAANMRKAFAINGRFPLNGKHVILLDDVFTTGATTSACARVLRAAGAAEVMVWTVARGV